jgi:hypothetical protein
MRIIDGIGLIEIAIVSVLALFERTGGGGTRKGC